MAQLVERVLGKDEVGGSNPPSSSKKNTKQVFFFLSTKIKPNLYGFKTLDAKIATPKGEISIQVKKGKIDVQAPDTIEIVFE